LKPVLEGDNEPRDPAPLGVSEPPVAAGVDSTHPGVMMPELGKRLVHEEGMALVREWIAATPRTR
jgi:hypothetical protein